jgi:hypothetical protein
MDRTKTQRAVRLLESWSPLSTPTRKHCIACSPLKKGHCIASFIKKSTPNRLEHEIGIQIGDDGSLARTRSKIQSQTNPNLSRIPQNKSIEINKF